jgi:predicted amidohydrolase
MKAADPYDGRESVVKRMIMLMREAKSRGCDLVVYPELALTPFFVVVWRDDITQADQYYEKQMPSPETQPLFAEAKKLGIGFYLGYAEYTEENGKVRRYNSSILVDKMNNIVGKYRKVHLPGHANNRPELPFQGLEKRYFDVGNYGFDTWATMGGIIGMCICNDRRWPETFRVMGLKNVEMVLMGYNTPTSMPWDTTFDDLTYFQNHLVLQAAAYQNSTWVVAAAKAGRDGPCELIGGSCIVSPSGEIAACAVTKGDELITSSCDLDLTQKHKQSVFNFSEHRQVQHYKIICETPQANAASQKSE